MPKLYSLVTYVNTNIIRMPEHVKNGTQHISITFTLSWCNICSGVYFLITECCFRGPETMVGLTSSLREVETYFASSLVLDRVLEFKNQGR